jgi:hypothetical protein
MLYSLTFSSLSRNWEGYVHPRAREYFTSHDGLIEALTSIAKNINQGEDPILVCDSCFLSLKFGRVNLMIAYSGTVQFQTRGLRRLYLNWTKAPTRNRLS